MTENATKRRQREERELEQYGMDDLPFAVEIEILVVAIEPSVDGVGFTRGLALHDAALAFDDGRVDRLAHELGRNENFDTDASVFQLASRLHSRPACEIRVVLEAHFADQHSVVLDHVLVVCCWI